MSTPRFMACVVVRKPRVSRWRAIFCLGSLLLKTIILVLSLFTWRKLTHPAVDTSSCLLVLNIGIEQSFSNSGGRPPRGARCDARGGACDPEEHAFFPY